MSDALPLLPDGYRLAAYDTVGSTNDEAKTLARAGAAAGTIVWARQQTAGRGRRGHFWVSPPGNLYMSVVARPGGMPGHAGQLSFVAALALGEALLELTAAQLPLSYKWPNDVLLGGRKLAGILLESETGARGAIEFVVIGIGVNLASRPEDVDFPAIALNEAAAQGVLPEMLLQVIVRHFDDWLPRWRREGFAPVRAAWLARGTGVGEEIRVRLPQTTLLGRFLDLDKDGALLLATAGGTRRVTAGEVFPAQTASGPRSF